MSQRVRRAASTIAAAVVLTLLASACSGDDEQTRDGPEPAAVASEVPEEVVVTDLGFGAVEGRLPRARRDALASEVQAVVDEWVDAAYLGDYPRTDFSAAWAHFTPGARRQAERDAALMSNSDIGAKIDGVEAETRRVRLDVLAVRQRPMGVTAHVVLRFATAGSMAQEMRVAARLYLTEGDQGWQVFGYDVTKGTV
ncbi:hypothetical protein GON03_01175 [Nocardioides sp. MAH-18]|uniref:SnoaL-like domain-containing protein n=1 Tax=Nocardioides agri TaxID=2682843 RepID=A0A6L6XM00_9ACTN|nr:MULTISPECIES: hypothetical protein [unclassified Nocardioides]MBA2956629.1 hypothetical protein [Nocardioides sp. CGMCC 1.13656]MVQ47773.1 hypothetical protein [Nocardioides sp. MAH-18]